MEWWVLCPACLTDHRLQIWGQRLFVIALFIAEADAEGLVLIDVCYFPEQGELF